MKLFAGCFEVALHEQHNSQRQQQMDCTNTYANTQYTYEIYGNAIIYEN